MFNNISSSYANMSADNIFTKLDNADKKPGDNKIEASVWNSFASIAGGNTIQNYIEKPAALKSITSYINKMTEEAKNNVQNYLNNIEQASNTGDSSSIVEKNKRTLDSAYQKLIGNLSSFNLPDGMTAEKFRELIDGGYQYHLHNNDLSEKEYSEPDLVYDLLMNALNETGHRDDFRLNVVEFTQTLYPDGRLGEYSTQEALEIAKQENGATVSATGSKLDQVIETLKSNVDSMTLPDGVNREEFKTRLLETLNHIPPGMENKNVLELAHGAITRTLMDMGVDQKKINECAKTNTTNLFPEAMAEISTKVQDVYTKAITKITNYLNSGVTFTNPYDETQTITGQDLLKYINNIEFVSVNFGAAEATDKGIQVNTNFIGDNGPNFNPDINVTDAVKVLIHESLHMAFKDSKNQAGIVYDTRQEEYACESQALLITSQMVNEGELPDSQIYGHNMSEYAGFYAQDNDSSVSGTPFQDVLNSEFMGKLYSGRPNIDGSVNINNTQISAGDEIYIGGQLCGTIGNDSLIDGLSESDIRISIPNAKGRISFSPQPGAQELVIKHSGNQVMTAYYIEDKS